MRSTRRGFLGALAAVPVLLKAGDCVASPGPAEAQDCLDKVARPGALGLACPGEATAVLGWKDGHRETVNVTAPLGRRILKATYVAEPDKTFMGLDAGGMPNVNLAMRQVTFERADRGFLSSRDGLFDVLPIYEEA